MGGLWYTTHRARGTNPRVGQLVLCTIEAAGTAPPPTIGGFPHDPAFTAQLATYLMYTGLEFMIFKVYGLRVSDHWQPWSLYLVGKNAKVVSMSGGYCAS